jgi:hypothetical protein
MALRGPEAPVLGGERPINAVAQVTLSPLVHKSNPI